MSVPSRQAKAMKIALILSAIAFAIAVAVFAMPKATEGSANSALARQLSTIRAETQAAIAESAGLSLANSSRLWAGDAQQVGSRSLDMLSRVARALKIKLVAFRPQRPVESEGLVQVPFLVIVEGSYPAVVSFVSTLEQPATKLALGSVQVTSSDASSDKVTASIVLLAFKRGREDI